jgi:hypothetical protein
VIRIVRGKGIVQDRFGANAPRKNKNCDACLVDRLGASTAETVNDEKWSFSSVCVLVTSEDWSGSSLRF